MNKSEWIPRRMSVMLVGVVWAAWNRRGRFPVRYLRTRGEAEQVCARLNALDA